ncbi:MAG TPA: M20 family metallopeptidase [Longimicrobiales bacterium]
MNPFDDVVDRLRTLVEFESPSGDEARISALAQWIAGEAERTGAAVTALAAPGAGLNLEVHLAGREVGLEPVLVLGHMDTVFEAGTLQARPFRVEDGRATGPGVYDMKGGLAVALQVLADWRTSGGGPRRPLCLLFTCDEEVGSHTSRPHILRLARGAAAVLVLEPCLAGGAAKTARKGVGDYRVRAVGRAAHAGEPDRGVNAITELAHQVLGLRALAAPERGTTLTPGRTGGGTASNVVAAEAWVDVDVRFTSALEAERVDAAMRTLEPVLPGAAIQVEGGISRPPLERTAGVVALYEHARGVALELGWQLGEGSSGGASDGSLTAAAGVPTLDGLGPDGGGAHAIHEFVLVEDLPRRVQLLRRLLETL